jgi:threonine/homoserine/homoserine lactone efflux protein
MIAELVAGLVLGYVGSIPAAGPLALLIVASGLERDIPRGARLAVGGATAEGLYALLAFWGVGEALPRHPLLIHAARGIGAVLLGLLGAALVRRKQAWGAAHRAAPRHGAALLGFSLVALNPAFLVTWTGFAALLASTALLSPGPVLAPAVALGAFLGVAGWFATLLALVGRRSAQVSPRVGIALLRICGGALLLMGAWLAIDTLRRAW